MAIKSIKGIKVGDYLFRNTDNNLFEHNFTQGKLYLVSAIVKDDKDTLKLIGDDGTSSFASVGDRLIDFIRVPKNCNMEVFKSLYVKV